MTKLSLAVKTIQKVKSNKISVSELMEDTIERINNLNGRVNAIVSLKEKDDLLNQAKKAEEIDSDNQGPLHGLPIAIKDLLDVKGLPTVQGSPIFANQIAKKDDIMVSRLRKAGAIIIGKTNTPEFGVGSNTFNSVFGQTYNPYNLDCTCGGSSGGAAVAVATGMLAIADGTDMMGSLRNPAAWNNIYGMRPTWGLVPNDPGTEVFLHNLSTSGPMARSPEDLALLLSVISGTDPRQPFFCSSNFSNTKQTTSLHGKTIGWLADWNQSFSFDKELLEMTEVAVKKFEVLGANVELLYPPFSREALWDSWTTLRSWCLASSLGTFFRDHNQKQKLKKTIIWEIERGLELSGADVLMASRLRSDWYSTSTGLFEKFDALVLPSAQVWPFSTKKEYPQEISGVQMDTYHRWMEVMIPPALIGLPVVNIPGGFGSNDLPFGLQVFGPKWSDADLLNIAQKWHEANDWPSLKRPCL